jgi:hypothetical protein
MLNLKNLKKSTKIGQLHKPGLGRIVSAPAAAVHLWPKTNAFKY